MVMVEREGEAGRQMFYGAAALISTHSGRYPKPKCLSFFMDDAARNV